MPFIVYYLNFVFLSSIIIHTIKNEGKKNVKMVAELMFRVFLSL